MCNEQQIIEQQSRLLAGRQMFDVELTTVCNKECYVCPREKLLRKNGIMSEETFGRLTTWLPKNCDVFFAGLGEPLQHKLCISFIRLLHDSGRGTSIMTNGILLSGEKVAELFDSGLDKLQISIIQKTDLKKIQYFTTIIPPEFKSNVVFNVIREKEMSSASKELKYLDDNGWRYCEKLAHNRAGLLYNVCNKSKVVTCATFFCDTFVNCDGEIYVCSSDINGKFKIGSVYEMSFSELIEYKKHYIGNKAVCPLCRSCNDEYRLKHFKTIEQ